MVLAGGAFVLYQRLVTAFANAYGGTLLLGISESSQTPKVATGITSIPRYQDLAERLKLMFRDCVEPPLPSLSIMAFPVDGDRGIVGIQTNRSLVGPHRVIPTSVCPIRRLDRCETLSMREIHDLTLSLSRNVDRVENTLADRGRRFTSEFQRLETPDDAFGLRYTTIPIGEDIRLDRVFENGSIIPEFSWPHAEVYRELNGETFQLKSLQNFHNMRPKNWRPILRGARGEDTHERVTGIQRYVYWEIHSNGLLECGYLSNRTLSRPGRDGRIETQLHPDVVVSTFSQLTAWADRLRSQAGIPTAEYGIQFEANISGGDVGVQKIDDTWSIPLGSIASGKVVFPIYSDGGENEGNRVLELFERDFYNCLGRDAGEGQGKLRNIER